MLRRCLLCFDGMIKRDLVPTSIIACCWPLVFDTFRGRFPFSFGFADLEVPDLVRAFIHLTVLTSTELQEKEWQVNF